MTAKKNYYFGVVACTDGKLFVHTAHNGVAIHYALTKTFQKLGFGKTPTDEDYLKAIQALSETYDVTCVKR